MGIIRPMYYHFPELDAAYYMDASGDSVQYMFGPDMLFSPVVQRGDTSQVQCQTPLPLLLSWVLCRLLLNPCPCCCHGCCVVCCAPCCACVLQRGPSRASVLFWNV